MVKMSKIDLLKQDFKQ